MMSGRKYLLEQTSATEAVNISVVMLDILRAMSSGTYHSRDIAEVCVCSERTVLRSYDKLLAYGAIVLRPASDPPRGGKGSRRLHRAEMTELGHGLLDICSRIMTHRGANDQ